MASAVLICDDEPEIRATLRRTLRGYAVVETGSPSAAREALRVQHFAAIVSDFSLGADTDGLDLLQHVRMLYPDTVRVLVTGSRDIEVAARAVNEGSVHRFFTKPWRDDKLRGALEILIHGRR